MFLSLLALIVVLLTGAYFLALAAVSLLAPARARHFLLSMAGSAQAHYSELAVRLAVGGAFVLHAPRMAYTQAFSAFGWVLLVTTCCLLLIPWQWHRKFAQWGVPQALRYLPLIALASLAIGLLILLCAIPRL